LWAPGTEGRFARTSRWWKQSCQTGLRSSNLPEEDDLQALDQTTAPITKLGDLWLPDERRLLCGDAFTPESYGACLSAQIDVISRGWK